MTPTKRQELQAKRDAAYWLVLFVMFILFVAFLAIAPKYIPVGEPEVLPFPWAEREADEYPCVSPSQRRYFEEQRKLQEDQP